MTWHSTVFLNYICAYAPYPVPVHTPSHLITVLAAIQSCFSLGLWPRKKATCFYLSFFFVFMSLCFWWLGLNIVTRHRSYFCHSHVADGLDSRMGKNVFYVDIVPGQQMKQYNVSLDSCFPTTADSICTWKGTCKRWGLSQLPSPSLLLARILFHVQCKMLKDFVKWKLRLRINLFNFTKISLVINVAKI